MEDAEMIALHESTWKPGSISISAREAVFIKNLISKHRPKSFLELGTAAGLSTVLIFKVLSETTSGRLITVDLNRNFVNDTSKPTGYLIDEHIGDDDRLIRMVGITSVDLDETVGDDIEMCFIDANHQHPWPMIDTLFVWPRMARDSTIIYHDLRLYQKAQGLAGIGPKYLFDQFPSDQKGVISDPDRNVFFVTKSMSDDDFARRIADGLLLPWSLRRPLPLDLGSKIVDRLSNLYPKLIINAFTAAFDRFNATH